MNSAPQNRHNDNSQNTAASESSADRFATETDNTRPNTVAYLHHHTGDPRETRRRIDDLEQRIERQQRRIAKMLIDRNGPADEMLALLDDMIKARESMLALLRNFEAKERI